MRQLFNSTAILLLVTGCGDNTPPPRSEPPQQPATVAPNAASTRRDHVSRNQYGDKWPLTVDSGEIECIDGFIVVFHHAGVTYALNGAATSRGYPEIDPIWKDNPNIPGAKINIGPLIDAGLRLCK